MAELRVLDGRNPNRIPEVKTITDFEIVAVRGDLFGTKQAICLKLDGMYVPAEKVLKIEPGYEWILCAEYKTFRGFAKWVERFL